MAQTLTLRTAARADLAAIDALLARTYPASLKGHYPPSVLVTAVPIIAHAKPDLIASGRYYVAAAEDGSIVAAGGWSARPPGAERRRTRTASIRHVVTDHRLQRRGIGRALMGHVMDEARGAGFGRFDCVATLAAMPFYATLGFRALERGTVHLAPGIEMEVMRMRRA